jgi:hypothetical protein
MEKKRNARSHVAGNPEGKKLLGRTKPRWEGNIKMDFKER